MNRSNADRALREWHEKFSIPIRNSPGMIPRDRAKLRLNLIDEELTELEEAIYVKDDIVAVADALGDLLYVVYGAAYEFGLGDGLLDECFAEIHRSNMTKVWPDGTVHYRPDGKVLKPDTYSPANLAPIVNSRKS